MGENPYYPLHIFIVRIHFNDITCIKSSETLLKRLLISKVYLNSRVGAQARARGNDPRSLAEKIKRKYRR